MGETSRILDRCAPYGTEIRSPNIGKAWGSQVEPVGTGESVDPVLVCSIIQDGVRFSSTSHTGESCMMW